MAIRFINRENELTFLEKKYKEMGPQVIIIYGRRRVGKTELINEFIKDKKVVYFLAERQEVSLQLERFSKTISATFDEPGISFKGWDSAFEYLASKAKDKRIIIAIDEFPYLIKAFPPITSIFQRICDEIIKESMIFLIICGSNISMMEDKVLSSKSPLYGRRTGQWDVKPLSFKDSSKFFERYSMEEKITLYSILGGIPAYLIQFSDKKDIPQNIAGSILSKGEVLYDEPIFLFNEEFREPRIYLGILEAVARGKTRLVEIANYLGIETRNLPKYLNVLERLKYVGKKTPMFLEKKKKRHLYFVRDNFFNFWFRFVYPNRSGLESKRMKEVLKRIAEELPRYTSKIFEDVAAEALLILDRKGITPFSIEEMRSYWGKISKERAIKIDIIAINKKEKKIMFCECKWKKNVNCVNVLNELKEKAESLEKYKKGYTQYYSIFAKSFEKKIKEKNVDYYDLHKLQKIFS